MTRFYAYKWFIYIPRQLESKTQGSSCYYCQTEKERDRIRVLSRIVKLDNKKILAVLVVWKCPNQQSSQKLIFHNRGRTPQWFVSIGHEAYTHPLGYSQGLVFFYGLKDEVRAKEMQDQGFNSSCQPILNVYKNEAG